MAVVAPQGEIFLRQRQGQKRLGLARFHRHAEFGIHLARLHGGEGMGIDAWGQPKQNRLAQPHLSGDPVQSLQLVHPVHDKAADPQGQTVPKLLIGFALVNL